MGRKTNYNDVFTPELWQEVNKENRRLLEDFLDYKNSSQKSKATINQYFQVLRLFFIWNLENNDNKFFVDIRKRDFIKFFNYLVNDTKSSPNRIINIRAIISSLSNYIENILDDEYPTYRNIVKSIETVTKQPVREKTILTKEQVDKCLKKLVKDGKFQIACFMALAVASGARKSELLRFKCSYFDDKNIIFGSIYKTPEKIVTKGNGSNGKLLYKYTFVKQFKPYFDLWMKERKKLDIENEYLFVIKRENGYEQASIHNANNWADVISKYLNCNFYFHSLRHFWTTELKRQNLPDDVIKELCGWSSLEMCALYSDLQIDDLLGNYFDENGVKSDIKVAKITDF